MIDDAKVNLINQKAAEMAPGFFELSHLEAMALLIILSDRIACASGERLQFWQNYNAWVSRVNKIIGFDSADDNEERGTIN